MLVYGDAKFSLPLKELFRNCRARIWQSNLECLDELRALLIFAGQIEQAIADAAVDTGSHRQLAIATAQLTDCLARFFCRKFISQENGAEKSPLIECLDCIVRTLASQSFLGHQIVTVKIPEGYAFYALFPEQYCVTALNWGRQFPTGHDPLVVGLRSIGTSLSAVVKETLCLMGRKSRRITVRPHGPPFQRQLDMTPVRIAADSPVLIVDEGPGISGSSMAAVAQAFAAAGLRNIHFLPGHANEPGPAASAPVREIWRRTPRYTTGLESIRWNGFSLERSLLAEANKVGGKESADGRVENISGGLWRKVVEHNTDCGISPPQFERMKFLCADANGNSLMWKFSGLQSDGDGLSALDSVRQRLSRLADSGYCPEPFAAARGFLAVPWIEGRRLTRDDANEPSILEWIGNYIVDAAKPPAFQNDIAIRRLAEMLHSNTKELLGEMFPKEALILTEAALKTEVLFAYGDGHLAPHEWIRTRAGKILKVDAEGHDCDHTLIGEQSWLWDVAGALVEWNLNPRTTNSLLRAIEGKRMRVDRAALGFYRAAYAAFRAGLTSFGISQASDEREKKRFTRASAFYINQLVNIFREEGAAGQSARSCTQYAVPNH